LAALKQRQRERARKQPEAVLEFRVPLSAESRHSAGRSKNDEIDPCATCAPRPVLAEHGLKDRSLDKPAQSELGSAMVAEMVEHSPNDESAYFVARVCVDF
jgi:hypothetical protein